MFRRRAVRIVAFAALSAAVAAGTAPAAHAQTPPAPATPYSGPPRAYIVIDQATGSVLSASNERLPLPPASLTKVLTALVAVSALSPAATVPISSRAEAMPAHKLNMKSGQVWPVGAVLSSLLASSANDAAAALAERVSGSLDQFHIALAALATRLQMADAPTLYDPSGLDDGFSVKGGNLISARDLAIAARAVLANDRLAPLVGARVVEFTGPDGVAHRLINHNKLLAQYPGAIGMKTGYTRKAGRGLIAAATRNGRTQIAVLLDVGDTYGWATQLLDAAFAQPVPKAGDRLPAIPSTIRITGAQTAAQSAPASIVESNPVAASSAKSGAPAPLRVGFVVLALLALAWCLLRARVVIRRRRRRRKHVPVRRHVNRRRDAALTPHYKPKHDEAQRFHEVTRR
ncbi:MAG TPA: hypothetical protein VMZ22_00185 [Acidimicrobiales bacterium]|nr:hypothetical protein [Acidimicrobiales bacterium]